MPSVSDNAAPVRTWPGQDVPQQNVLLVVCFENKFVGLIKVYWIVVKVYLG